jgi:apolipoprotein N-acyltransferase
VLVNISNDGYFGHSEAREQHLLMVRMRAVENRRYILRATNDGITAVINPAGLVLRRLPSYQEIAAPLRYGLVESTTFYAKHGDWFAWSCLAIAVSLALLNLYRSRERA